MTRYRLFTRTADDPPPPDSWRNGVLLGHWDESPLRAGTHSSYNYYGNKGVDTAMRAVLGGTGNVSQLQKAYPSSWETDWASSAVQQSGEFGHAFMTNMPPPGALSTVISGTYDTQLVAWVNSIPLTETAYTCFQNEPDNVFSSDPDTFNQACGYVINLLAPIYRSRGLQGGIGTVLMGYPVAYGDSTDGTKGAAYFDRWDYLQYVDAGNIDQVVYMMDCYAKMAPDGSSYDAYKVTYDGVEFESVTNITKIAFDQARSKYGVHRFGIGETGNSRQKRFDSSTFNGTSVTQQIWIENEIESLCQQDGMEFVEYFHKPTGKESQYDQLLDNDDGAGGMPFTTYAQEIVEA